MASIMWFRRGLRLHDNPALLSAVEGAKGFAAVYIFDPTAGNESMSPGYHYHSFLLECLEDLNKSLLSIGTKLFIFAGKPVTIFRYLHAKYSIEKICFEQDCEPIWHARDNAVKSLCSKLKIQCEEKVSHTLWDPVDIMKANGGTPPLTHDMFTDITLSFGDPPKPVADVSWEGVEFLTIDATETTDELFKMFSNVPTIGEIGVKENVLANQNRRLKGGETVALEQLFSFLKAEEDQLIKEGLYRPLDIKRDSLVSSQQSMSAAIALGTVSVRLLHWKTRDLYKAHNKDNPSSKVSIWIPITSQLIWREYFYTMCRLNPKYGGMAKNPICLQIPWKENEAQLEKWKTGKTGYPFIDAGMRQLLQEGWMHHSVRTAAALFLTRGDLWLSWEKGCAHFRAHLVDHDWAVNAGNWMWVSSSAFDRLLDCSLRIDPVSYGKQLEPTGDFIRRYVPELAQFSSEYIHEPWTTSDEEQREAKCIIGKHYPDRMVIHEFATMLNCQWMEDYRQAILQQMMESSSLLRLSRPSSNIEIFKYFFQTERIGNLKKKISTFGVRRHSAF